MLSLAALGVFALSQIALSLYRASRAESDAVGTALSVTVACTLVGFVLLIYFMYAPQRRRMSNVRARMPDAVVFSAARVDGAGEALVSLGKRGKRLRSHFVVSVDSRGMAIWQGTSRLDYLLTAESIRDVSIDYGDVGPRVQVINVRIANGERLESFRVSPTFQRGIWIFVSRTDPRVLADYATSIAQALTRRD